MVRYIVGSARHLPAHGIHLTLFHRRREVLNPSHLNGLTCDVVGLPDCSVVFWEQLSVPAALAMGGFHLYHAVAERGVPLLAPCPVTFTLHSATPASYCDLVRRGTLPGPASQISATTRTSGSGTGQGFTRDCNNCGPTVSSLYPSSRDANSFGCLAFDKAACRFPHWRYQSPSHEPAGSHFSVEDP